MHPEFLALLTEARERHGSVGALAEVLRLTRQRTSDALGGGRGYSLDVERCLRLALDGRHNPYEVLRKGGHTHEAAILETMFGPWLADEADRRALRAVADRLVSHAVTTDDSAKTAPDPPRTKPRRRRK